MTTAQTGNKVEMKRKNLSALFPLPEAAKNPFEVLRLGPESLARPDRELPSRDDYRPGSIQDSERPSRNGAICRGPTIAGIIEERASKTHQACNMAPPPWIAPILSRQA